MEIVNAMENETPGFRVAVIDKDEPGGICLTRGCIPSKILLYHAELVRTIESAGNFGIQARVEGIDFQAVMERMRRLISADKDAIRQGLTHTANLDYYDSPGEFVAPYTLKVENETIKSSMIFVCAGSRPIIPAIEGLDEIRYETSDTVLNLNELPKSMVIIGGGYIAAEYGHFFSAMGSKVAIIGRNRQFLPEEEPEVSALAKRELQKHLTLLTDHEVQKVTESSTGMKTVVAVNRENGKPVEFEAETVLVAAGRGSNSDILHPEKAGIKTDDEGWIIVDDYLETSQPNVWALGDADGRYLFKHVANHEALTVYLNAVGKKKVKVDYHAVPHAVFMVPEVASVGLKEKEAVEKYGKSNLLIGVERFQDTAKGLAMDVTDCFAKIILESNTLKILGAHIIGPCASLLIQEVINLMYTPTQDAEPILQAMHIHPALSEVVQRAVGARVPVDHYHHMMEGHYKLPLE
jgi:dihydrolipoamide dehydrogenase